MTTTLPPSVNWHLTSICNMRCRFCFAGFAEVKKHFLPKDAALKLAAILGATFSKVSVAGGEALLCPYIIEVFRALKQQGTTTALITNGSLLIDRPELLTKLAPFIDWIGISIDSFVPHTQERLGRARNGHAYKPQQYLDLAESIRSMGIRLKVNTVLTQLSLGEDMADWIRQIRPERWKLFQVLPILGENDGRIDDLIVTERDFISFVERHRAQLGDIVVAESNEAMTGSYAMIDPAGHFFDNAQGYLSYSSTILDVGLEQAWRQAAFDNSKFVSRGGLYDWQTLAVTGHTVRVTM